MFFGVLLRFLAAMGSSRSDVVTKSVRSSVCLFIMKEFFFSLRSYKGVSWKPNACFNEVSRMFHASFILIKPGILPTHLSILPNICSYYLGIFPYFWSILLGQLSMLPIICPYYLAFLGSIPASLRSFVCACVCLCVLSAIF